MSSMIKCDRMMYTDSRSPKGAYWEFKTNGIDGFSIFHLCRNCYLDFRAFLGSPIPEDELSSYDDNDWGEEDKEWKVKN